MGMLSLNQISSAGGAARYFTHAMSSDYHAEGGRVTGTWHGLAAQRLGLDGHVTPEAFAALAHNCHPVSGEQLTLR